MHDGVSGLRPPSFWVSSFYSLINPLPQVPSMLPTMRALQTSPTSLGLLPVTTKVTSCRLTLLVPASDDNVL